MPVNAATPNLACLFWFYKSPEICENRIQILRRYNPDIAIYGLYGGNPADANAFRQRLTPWLDDFYTFTLERTNHWKWYHGDQMIVEWYRQHGHKLDWDTLFIAQWDMLVCDALANQFHMLRKDELLLSGLRPVSEVDPWWYYLRPGSPEREEYDRFIAHVREHHAFDHPPLCCEFIIACLPRCFMTQYADISKPELGFLEYKIPIYAQIFGTPLCMNHHHQPWWGDDPGAQSVSQFGRALNSERHYVPLRVIEAHRFWPGGQRIFHPVFDLYPVTRVERIVHMGSKILHNEIKSRWRRWHQKHNPEDGH